MKKIVVQPNDSGQRVDKFLVKAFKHLPKSMIYKSLRIKNIKINRKRCYGETVLQAGDILEIYIKDELLEQTVDYSFQKSSGIYVVYEDENIIVVEKPVGVLSHSDTSQTTDHLVNRIKRYLFEAGEYDPKNENSFSPAICSRLDRNTGGLVLAAKNALALREANALVRDRKIHKFYIAQICGHISLKEGLLEGTFLKNEAQNKMFYSESDEAKNTVTKYKILKEYENTSLVDIELVTGRTHQIRAQFSHIGNPLVGDKKYGGSPAPSSNFQLLYAYKIIFDVPENNIFEYLNNKPIIANNIPKHLNTTY